MNGWIKLHRKMLEWEWYSDNNVKILFLHIMLKASYRHTRWHGIEVLPGQLITSLDSLSEETGLTVRQVRTALDKLKSTGELTIKVTNRFRVITIENYTMYQDATDDVDKQDDKQDDRQMTSERQTDDKQMTTSKEDKEDKEVKKVKKSKLKDTPYAEIGHMTLYHGEYNKLVADFGELAVRRKIEGLRNWAKIERVKDANSTLRNWLNKDLEQKTQTTTAYRKVAEF